MLNPSLITRIQSLFVPEQSRSELTSEQLALHLPRLRSYIAAKVSERQDVDDLLQETVSKTLTAAQQSRIQNPVAYATQVAKSVILDYWRHRNAQPHALPLDEELIAPEPTPEEHKIQQQKIELVTQTLNQMPTLRRDIFIKRRLDGMSREAIANEFELSVEGVKKHLTRAMVTLSLELAKHGMSTSVNDTPNGKPMRRSQ